mgnify:CR=1 FL=1
MTQHGIVKTECVIQLFHLGLAEQNDLQQFAVGRFKIGQQADFLEGRDRHALRFFDEHDDLFACRMTFEQMRVEHLHYFEMSRFARWLQVQFLCDRVQDFFRGNTRIGKVDGFDVRRQPCLQQAA